MKHEFAIEELQERAPIAAKAQDEDLDEKDENADVDNDEFDDEEEDTFDDEDLEDVDTNEEETEDEM
jgi:hypothetical protein